MLSAEMQKINFYCKNLSLLGSAQHPSIVFTILIILTSNSRFWNTYPFSFKVIESMMHESYICISLHKVN